MQPFIVNLHRLGGSVTELDRTIGKEFFESFGNPDILGAALSVACDIVRHGVTVDVECSISGTLTVPCDRCLEPLEIPVETEFSETYAPDGDELDFSQDVYDYAITALPLQRVHPEDQCNPETVKFLSK
ncbi:MAG: DUF177 domain-containing protein [Bacteroidales bacterium]|nr:DUF177 domain-containing protein [Bacteroidales bacterium]